MLTVICKHIKNGNAIILREGRRFKLGGIITKRSIEMVAGLPEYYNVGEWYNKGNYLYIVVEK